MGKAGDKSCLPLEMDLHRTSLNRTIIYFNVFTWMGNFNLLTFMRCLGEINSPLTKYHILNYKCTKYDIIRDTNTGNIGHKLQRYHKTTLACLLKIYINIQTWTTATYRFFLRISNIIPRSICGNILMANGAIFGEKSLFDESWKKN